MSKAEPTTSDQCEVPRLGLLQCPNAESLGWAPSEPGSAVTSDCDGKTLLVAAAKKSSTSPRSLSTSKIQSIDVKNNDLSNREYFPKRQRLLDPAELVTDHSTANTDGCATDTDGCATEAEVNASNETVDDFFELTHKSKSDSDVNVMDDAKPNIEVTLDYETNSSDSMHNGKLCQILKISIPCCCGDHNSSMLSNASILVGTISGKAKLELLPQSPEESNSLASSCASIFLDIFGYRIPCNNYGKDNSIVINRPDWMNPIPLSVVTDNFRADDNVTSIFLRVKLHSIYDENDTSTSATTEASNNESYYSAYAEESYNIKTLPPNHIYPDNYTAGGLGVTTILEHWKTTMDSVTKTLHQDESDENSNFDRILICGAKGCGKSTMLRYATNRITSKRRNVAILDLDAGQPELSVSGLITLTIVSRPLLSDPPVHMVHGGLNDNRNNEACKNNDDDDNDRKVHPSHHEAAFFFGDITSKSDPDKYIQMATLLLQKYNYLKEERTEQGKGNLPLLINTDGWVKGFGYEVLCAIIEAADPGNIIQMLGTTKTKSFNLPSHSSASRQRCIHAVQSFDESIIEIADNDNSSRRSIDCSYSAVPLQANASDHRKNRFCAYFMGGYETMSKRKTHFFSQSEAVAVHKEKGIIDQNNTLGLTIASMPPYAVPFHSVTLYAPPGFLDGVSEVEPSLGTQGHLASDEVLDALNGSVVGLCSRENLIGSTKFLSNYGVPNYHCIGLGIIRSIDRDSKLFFVLTPVHPVVLSAATVFVGGNIGLPLELVYRGTKADSFPFLSEHSLALPRGGDVMKSRNHPGRKKISL